MPRPDASAKLKGATAATKEGPSKIIIGGIIAALAIIALVAAVIWKDQADKKDAPPAKGWAADGAGFTAYKGKAGTPTVDIFEDPQCPGCGAMERSVGPRFLEDAKAGKFTLVYHPMTFVGSQIVNNDSSWRGVNAFMCASDADAFEGVHSQLFQNQPAEEGTGFTDDQLLEFGKSSGIQGDAFNKYQSCVKEHTYKDAANKAQLWTDKLDPKVESTPTVRVNGEKVDFDSVKGDPEGTYQKFLAKITEQTKDSKGDTPAPAPSTGAPAASAPATGAQTPAPAATS